LMDRDSTTRTGAKDPWGREGRPPAQRHVEASIVLDTEPGLLLWRKRAKGRSKLRGSDRMPGAGLRLRACRKALSDMLALKPYWGKPAVRNFRGGDGNVGIIRSPVRAIAPLDHSWERSRGDPSRVKAMGLCLGAACKLSLWSERLVRMRAPSQAPKTH
jgi:hypothetical protein